MSSNSISYFQSLPVEILYRIFDNLDAQTILLSLRNTCRRLKTIGNKYDQYILNFKSISKSNFHLLCRLVDPQNVISLIFTQDDQIEYFLSFYSIRRFIRLRSLTLLAIEERHLQLILKRFNIRSLNSFLIEIRKSDDRYRNPTAKLISSTIAQPNLRKFQLDFPAHRMQQISWPEQCMINYLRIGTFSFEVFDHACSILCCSPHLQTLVISCSPEVCYFKNARPAPFRQLTSLTFENVRTKVNYLELFLSLTPSLIYLKVIGNGDFLDGNRWEQFIQANLPLLDKFEFYFIESVDIKQTPTDVEAIIALYRTPFWIKYKKWFVTCEYNIDWSGSIELYSMPICKSVLEYKSESKKVSLSTLSNVNDIDMSTMNNVNNFILDFTKLIPSDLKLKRETTSGPLFGKLNRLDLAFHANRPLGWVPFLSALIDLTTVTEIQLTGSLIEQADSDILADITNLLHRTCNLSSFDIHSDRTSRESRLTAKNICLMIPSHVKHLATLIKNVDEVEILLERLQYLISAKFYFNYGSSSNRITAWLTQNKKGSICRTTNFSVCVWLGKNTIQNKELNLTNKRIKLIDDRSDS